MEKIRAVIAAGSGIFHYEVEKHKDVAEALTRFAQVNVDAICILGDRALASATYEHIIEKNALKGRSIPLAILPVGENNVVAEGLGIKNIKPHLALKDLLDIYEKEGLQNKIIEYPLIKIEGVRGVGSLYGLFFCAGNIIKKKTIFTRKTSTKGWLYHLRNWAGIIDVIQSAYRAALEKNKLENAIRVNRNQRGAVVGHFFMLLITTLDKSVLGVSLNQEKKRDRAHFISVENTPQAILETGKLMLRGRYEGLDHPGNIIAEIQHARIVLQTAFVLDGSFYEADDTHELFLTITDHLKFITLA